MSITPTYPGVYVNLVPSGSRTMTGVATSITAFVGSALRGPVNTPVPISNFADFVRAFGPLWRQSGLGYSVRDFYLNGGGPAWVVRVANGATAAQLAADTVPLAANGPGSWANKLEARVIHPSDEDAEEVARAQGIADSGALFTLELKLGDEVETFVNVTTTEGPRRLDTLLTGSRLARVAGALPAARPAASLPDPADPAGLRLLPYPVTTDGVDGLNPNADSYVPPGGGRTGLGALEEIDLFNILVLPPVTPSGQLPDGVAVEALKIVNARRAFLILDPPPDATLGNMTGWATGAGLSGTPARNAAVYFPRVQASDPLRGGAVDTFAASGAMAGLYARTDATRGVWKAPAGIEAGLVGALGPAQVLTDDQNGSINPQGVNAIRSFPGAGTVSWGARTLRGSDQLSDEYKYIPIRRLALFLEESLYRGTQWVVFEPNDEPLWSQIRMSVGSFMQDLFRKGAFQGASPKEAYFVRCSSETTTQYDIDRGVVNIAVGFAPLKPAEFVLISIQQKSAAPQA